MLNSVWFSSQDKDPSPMFFSLKTRVFSLHILTTGVIFVRFWKMPRLCVGLTTIKNSMWGCFWKVFRSNRWSKTLHTDCVLTYLIRYHVTPLLIKLVGLFKHIYCGKIAYTYYHKWILGWSWLGMSSFFAASWTSFSFQDSEPPF